MIRKLPSPNEDNFIEEIAAEIEHKIDQRFSSSFVENNEDQNSESQSSDGFLFNCYICSSGFVRPTDLSDHLRHQHFICSLCPDASYSNSQELNLHLATQHPDHFQLTTGEKPFECHACPAEFTCEPSLNTHVQNDCAAAKAKRFRLDIPTATATVTTQDTASEQRDGRVFKQNQTNCPEIKQPKSLTQQQGESNNLEAEDKCDIPEDSLVFPAGPEKLVTKRSTQFQCDHCPQKFTYRSLLRFHSASHNKKEISTSLDSSDALTVFNPEVEDPYACSVCVESYKTSKELNLHLGTQHPDQFQLIRQDNRIHARAKTMQCPHCPKKFVAASKLKDHIRTHFDESPFICDDCGSRYKHAATLRKHKGNCQSIPKKYTFQCDENIENEGQVSTDMIHYFICLHCEYLAPSPNELKTHQQTCPGLLTSESSIINEIQEQSQECQEVELVGEIEIKYV